MLEVYNIIPVLGILSSCFFYKKLKDIQNKFNYSLEISQGSIALCHDIYLVLISSLYLYKYISDYTWFIGNGISLGYATYDLYAQYLIGKNYTVMIHHVVMIVTYLNPTLVHYKLIRPPLVELQYYIACTSLCEIPSIFLSTSYLLYKFNQTNTFKFKFCTFMLLTTYIPFRLINFPRIAIFLLKNDPYYYTTICISTFTMLSYYWFYYLCKKFYRVITGNKNEKKI